MSETLIPFALDANNSLVEVFDVPGGKQCNCRCPSCLQGVVARHGKKKVWHFAHDPNADTKPVEGCELSFYSCCRLYLVERAAAGELSYLSLPELVVEEHIGKHQRMHRKALVTESRELEIEKYGVSGPYDLETKLGNYTLAVHIEYPGRLPPEMPKNETTGLLSVDITPLESLYRRAAGQEKRILPMLKSLLSRSTEWPGSIKWLYHPRTELTRSILRQELIQEFDPTLDHPQKSEVAPYQATPLPTAQKFSDSTIEGIGEPSGRFLCLKCHNQWKGERFSDASCENCNTHLYSRFRLN